METTTITISIELSKLLKSSLTSKQLETLATKHKVYINTIRRIRDRKTKKPNKEILIDLLKMSIKTHKKQITANKAALSILQQELKKISPK